MIVDSINRYFQNRYGNEVMDKKINRGMSMRLANSIHKYESRLTGLEKK